MCDKKTNLLNWFVSRAQMWLNVIIKENETGYPQSTDGAKSDSTWYSGDIQLILTKNILKSILIIWFQRKTSMTRVWSILQITENIYLILGLCTWNFTSGYTKTGYEDHTEISNLEHWLFHI